MSKSRIQNLHEPQEFHYFTSNSSPFFKSSTVFPQTSVSCVWSSVIFLSYIIFLSDTMAIRLKRISPSLYLMKDTINFPNDLVNLGYSKSQFTQDIYFCILFSITGRTALIQSSWLHVPEDGQKQE